MSISTIIFIIKLTYVVIIVSPSHAKGYKIQNVKLTINTQQILRICVTAIPLGRHGHEKKKKKRGAMNKFLYKLKQLKECMIKQVSV